MANPVNRIDSTPARISTNLSIQRQTPKQDFGDRMKAGLAGGGSTAGGITPAAVGHVFQDVLDGVSALEGYLRLRGAASGQGMPAVMSEIALVKLQISRLVQRATSNPPTSYTRITNR